MQTSETIKEIALALCQFQSAQCKATKKNTNPAFKTKYSGINDVLESVLPTMTECGLCFVQFPDEEALTTRLMHVSGEWMQAAYTLKPVQATPQASGSAITYARRYALLSILGLGTEDDDAQSASAQPSAAQVQAQALQSRLILGGLRALTEAADIDEITAIWKANPGLQANPTFKQAATEASKRVKAHV